MQGEFYSVILQCEQTNFVLPFALTAVPRTLHILQSGALACLPD